MKLKYIIIDTMIVSEFILEMCISYFTYQFQIINILSFMLKYYLIL